MRMVEIDKLEKWVTILFVLLAICIFSIAIFYIYSNSDLDTFCKSKNGIYEGDYVIKNNCLIKNEDSYIRYSIERDDKNKPILVKE